jgi:hypothetical protein
MRPMKAESRPAIKKRRMPRARRRDAPIAGDILAKVAAPHRRSPGAEDTAGWRRPRQLREPPLRGLPSRPDGARLRTIIKKRCRFRIAYARWLQVKT